MPVGAYLGRAELMEQVAPLGPVYQAGTLSGNPLAMAAGLATLRELGKSGVYERLETLGARLQAGWEAALERHAVPGSVARVGSLLWMVLQEGPTPRTSSCIAPKAAEVYGRMHPRVLERGVWLAPSAYEVAFLSTAHDESLVDRAIEAVDQSLAEVAAEA
jgi:glutamate-1-semialdehyde 2,1-aminomutase